MRRFSIIAIGIGLFIGCATVRNGDSQDLERGRGNILVPLWKPFAPRRIKGVYDHTLIKFYRARSDCQPDCPAMDIWRYKYRVGGETIVDIKPISTRKKYWKSKDEARIMAVTLYGDKAVYYDGLIEYIDSFEYIKKANGIKDRLWGYETFTVRVYVAKRNPKFAHLGSLKGETPDTFIEKLLALGCEIVYVDNHMEKVGRDATFWRFMLLAEKMPKGQQLRYIIRDADWRLTAGELFAGGEGMHSGQRFHRFNQPACMGPLTASFWGGVHEGDGFIPDMANYINYFPYRFEYGDDELFSRDIIWPKIKSTSVLTHFYKRGWRSTLGNPYAGSCEEPTQVYCDMLKKGGVCPDRLLPADVAFPVTDLGLRLSLEELQKNPQNFDMKLNQNERGRKVRRALAVTP